MRSTDARTAMVSGDGRNVGGARVVEFRRHVVGAASQLPTEAAPRASQPGSTRVVTLRPRARPRMPAVTRPALVPHTGRGIVIRLEKPRGTSSRADNSSSAAWLILAVAATLALPLVLQHFR